MTGAPAPGAGDIVEYAFLPGLEPIVRDEIGRLLGHRATLLSTGPGTAQVRVRGSLADSLAPRTAGVAYLLVPLELPRPRALLGEENLRVLVSAVERVAGTAAASGRAPFRSMRFSAAGRDSPVFRRLAAELARRTGLAHDSDDGDMVIRVVPDAAGRGWKVALRLTPRPLSARPWRVARFRGALEPTAAAAMVQLSRPERDDVFVDLCCGSATLLIERLLAGPARAVVGGDVSQRALAAAATNLAAAGLAGRARLVRMDAARPPLRDGYATKLVANPPWGHRRGSHATNRALYPGLLSAAARAAAPGATFVLITHEVRLFDDVLGAQRDWRAEALHRIALRGHHPRIWVLRRASREDDREP